MQGNESSFKRQVYTQEGKMNRTYQNNMQDTMKLSADKLDSESSNYEEIIENQQDMTTSKVSLL